MVIILTFSHIFCFQVNFFFAIFYDFFVMTRLFLTYFLYLQVDIVFSFVNLKMVFFDFWVQIIPYRQTSFTLS